MQLITKREAEDDETVQALAEALRDYAGYFDQALTALAADGAPAEIWSDASESEWRIRAAVLLHQGTRNEKVARVVRLALDIHETVVLYAWLGGDSWRTLRFMRDHGVKLQHSRARSPMFRFGGRRQAPAPAAPVNPQFSAPDAPQGGSS